jgi:phage shock protein A
MTALLQIDTLAYSKQLREAGASEALAEAIAVNYPRLDTTDLVTHEKLEAEAAKIRKEMEANHSELKLEISEFRAELVAVESRLKGDIASVRTELTAEIGKTNVLVQSVLTEVKNTQLEMRTAQLMQLRWTLGLGVAMLGTLVASVALF